MRKSVPVAALVVVLSAVAGGLFGGRLVAQQDRGLAGQQLFTAALAAVETGYVTPVEAEQVVYSGIDGMLRTLDPHSSFFTPRDYTQMRERQEGHYYGLGLGIVSIDGDITVTQIYEGSPAYRAGIRRQDVIAKVMGQDAKGWTTVQAAAKMRGPKKTTVNISIRRPGATGLIDLTVERDEINITTVRTAFSLAPGTGYIRLQEFSETTEAEVAQALKKLTAAGMQRLVLDLRDDPGGALNAALAVANDFIKRGQKIVLTKGRVPNSNQDYVAETQGGYTTVPLIVLVNRGSASASEIVSGCLQDHDRALIIGERTFGKALVQSVYQISEGAGLALTTGRYYTPSGRLIQRPWDSAFDDYAIYTLRDQTETRSHQAAELKYTDGGRPVYGGGGIEPDHFMAGPVEGFNPTRFSRILVGQGAFVGFARFFTAEGDTRPAARSAAHKISRGFEVTDALLEEFKQYLVSQHVKVDEAAFKADAAFLKAAIRFEVDVDLFGAEEAFRNLSKVDPQVQYALGFFDEAAKLLTLGRGKDGK
jgi:carboxyl-terminal processing protease